jgi:hypothetical protein
MRPPEHGRIRFGERYTTKNGKQAMRALTTFRFTSPDKQVVEQLAALYGGSPQPWTDPKASPQNQFEVYTDASNIEVLLPMNDAFSQNYEMWGGRGIELRCDGQQCIDYRIGGKVERPCVCSEQTEMRCKPYTRVNMILPNVNFGGVWRLEVKGQAFLHEAPGMIAAIQQLQTAGMTRVNLLLTQRTSRVIGPGGKPQVQQFVVPQFSVAITPDQMIAGISAVKLSDCNGPAMQALPSHKDDNEITEAEIIDDIWHKPMINSKSEHIELVDTETAKEEPEGWDVPPPDVSVRKNPLYPNGPKWIRKC